METKSSSSTSADRSANSRFDLGDFGSFLFDFQSLLGWLGKLALLAPFVDVLVAIGPPWPERPAVAAVSAFAQLAVLMFAFVQWRRTNASPEKQYLNRFLIAIAILAVSAIGYVIVYREFVCIDFKTGKPVAVGFYYAPGIDELVEANQWSRQETLNYANYVPEKAWTSGSITAVIVCLLVLWLGIWVGAAAAIAAFIPIYVGSISHVEVETRVPLKTEDTSEEVPMAKQFSDGYAVVVGISDYPHVSKLPEAVIKDARDIAELLQSPDYCGYLSKQVKLLLNEAATADGIRNALKDLAKVAGPGDTAVVFFSGHGGRVDGAAEASSFLIPFNCEPQRLRDTAISAEELTALFRAIKAERLVVLLDACHSAGAGELKALAPSPNIKGGLSEETYNALAQGGGRVVMASSRSSEVSLVLHGMNNSLFTHYLLEALKGGALTRGDGVVRVFDVFEFVSDKVPARAPSQHPIFKAHNMENNFPLALYQGGKKESTSGESPSRRPSAFRPAGLKGPTKVAITRRLVDRWQELATYFDIPGPDRAKLHNGNEPTEILLWLEQRGRLSELRDAFNFLGWDDLIEELDSHTT